VSENYLSKKNYDISTKRVSITTIHSAKGLDYSIAFLLGLDFLKPNNWTEEQILRLVYVAITRARYQLFIPFIQNNFVIERLKKSLKLAC
jgi:ATP-dependent exoDNAse (exonuclease V) beta subunit